MRYRAIKWIEAYGGAAEVVRDAHVYGGGLLVAIGASAAWLPLGPVVFGGLLVFIGLRRVA